MPFRVTAPSVPPVGRDCFEWHWDSVKYKMLPGEVRIFEDRDVGPARQAVAIYKGMQVQQVKTSDVPDSKPAYIYEGRSYETMAELTEAIRNSVSLELLQKPEDMSPKPAAEPVATDDGAKKK